MVSSILKGSRVNALPAVPEAGAVYFVRVPGSGFRLRIADKDRVPLPLSVDWADVLGAPATFPPAGHFHGWDEITGKPTTLAGYGITDAVGSSDPRLADSREWSAPTISQVDAEAGTGTARQAWTAQRVFQAVAAWWNASTDKLKLDGIAPGATANLGTVTSVSGTGSASGLSLSGTVTGSGNLTLSGTVTVSNANWSGAALAVANGGTGAPDAAGARSNLGLGTAATATLSTSAVDNSSGRVPYYAGNLGIFGLGAVFGPQIADLDAASIPSGLYFFNTASGTAGTAPGFSAGAVLVVQGIGAGTQAPMMIAMQRSSGTGAMAWRTSQGGAWGAWQTVSSSTHTHANATTSVAGFMSGADKTKLDSVSTGANNYVHPNHTGDVTSTGDGATLIANDAVTYAKMQNVSGASRLIGRGSSSGAGDPEEVTLGSGLSMTGTVLSATGGAVEVGHWLRRPKTSAPASHSPRPQAGR